jgi:hypothetical protein
VLDHVEPVRFDQDLLNEEAEIVSACGLSGLTCSVRARRFAAPADIAHLAWTREPHYLGGRPSADLPVSSLVGRRAQLGRHFDSRSDPGRHFDSRAARSAALPSVFTAAGKPWRVKMTTQILG